MTSIQLALATLLREIAAWRRQRADEYDKDPRNLVTAAGLDALAEYLLDLPAEDERLVALGGDRVAWRHPLLRSAAYQALSPPDRRR